LAEAALAVAMSLSRRGIVTRRLGGEGQSGRLLVSSGRAVANTEVRIVSATGSSVPDGIEGEIQVRGAGVSKSFWNDNGLRSATCSEGWNATGDLGVLSEGELHVSGRIKEVIVLNGQNFYPQDIEECIRDLAGVRSRNAIAFGRPGAGSEQLVLVVEAKPPVNAAELRRRLRAHARERLGISVADIAIVGRGVITRTTSGKLRRRAMRDVYLSGDLLLFPTLFRESFPE
jgi:fatty-acyl-CoA synthase